MESVHFQNNKEPAQKDLIILGPLRGALSGVGGLQKGQVSISRSIHVNRYDAELLGRTIVIGLTMDKQELGLRRADYLDKKTFTASRKHLSESADITIPKELIRMVGKSYIVPGVKAAYWKNGMLYFPLQ